MSSFRRSYFLLIFGFALACSPDELLETASSGERLEEVEVRETCAEQYQRICEKWNACVLSDGQVETVCYEMTDASERFADKKRLSRGSADEIHDWLRALTGIASQELLKSLIPHDVALHFSAEWSSRFAWNWLQRTSTVLQDPDSLQTSDNFLPLSMFGSLDAPLDHPSVERSTLGKIYFYQPDKILREPDEESNDCFIQIKAAAEPYLEEQRSRLQRLWVGGYDNELQPPRFIVCATKESTTVYVSPWVIPYRFNPNTDKHKHQVKIFNAGTVPITLSFKHITITFYPHQPWHNVWSHALEGSVASASTGGFPSVPSPLFFMDLNNPLQYLP